MVFKKMKKKILKWAKNDKKKMKKGNKYWKKEKLKFLDCKQKILEFQSKQRIASIPHKIHQKKIRYKSKWQSARDGQLGNFSNKV